MDEYKQFEQLSDGRHSLQRFQLGVAFLAKPNAFASLKPLERWIFLEQLAWTAFDAGEHDLSRVCVDRLAAQFPNSPRVRALQGMTLEDHVDLAIAFYENELQEDETNIAVRKRLITLYLHEPTLNKHHGIKLLVDYLDAVYSDVEAWSELVEAYISLSLLEQAQSALGDLMLLQPHNAFHMLKYAEIAFSLSDFELAYRSFLRTIELCGKSLTQGPGLRAVICLKNLIPKLVEKGLPGSKAPSPHSVSGTPSPQQLVDVDALITEQLLEAYDADWSKPGDKAPSPIERHSLKTWISRVSIN